MSNGYRMMIGGKEVSRDEFIGDTVEAVQRTAEMLEARQPPGHESDLGFLTGLATRTPEEHLRLAKTAKRHGYSVSQNDYYISGLADFHGDPKGFIRSRDDVKRAAIERGLKVEGAVDMDCLPPVEELQARHKDIGVDPKVLEEETRSHERVNKVKLQPPERREFKEKLYNLRKPKDTKTKFTPEVHDRNAV
jgi:hypothetical protein